MTFKDIPMVDRLIIAKAAAKSGYEVEALMGRGKVRDLAHARQDCWLELRRGRLTLERIGAYFCRDHTTILYGVRAAEHREARRARGLS